MMNLPFGFTSTSHLVIDPGRHTLKVGIGALGVKGRSARLNAVYTVKTGITPQHSPEDVLARTGSLIREVIKRHGLSAKQVSFAIPGRASFVRQLKIPRVSGDRLNRLIQYEARQQIPFPIEDIILDSHVFEADGPEQAVTLVAIRRTIVDQYCEMLQDAGLVPDVIDVTNLALFNCFYPQLADEEQEDVVALVDIGASTTDIVVCRSARVEFIRSAPQAGDHLTKKIADQMGLEWDEAEELKLTAGQLDPSIDRQTDPLAFGEGDQPGRVRVFLSKAFEDISNEIRRTLDFYVSQPDGEPIGKILLTGGTAAAPGIADFIENRLGVPCEAADCFARTHVAADALEKGPLEKTAAVLVGQAQKTVADVPLRMNFLPPYIIRRKEFEKRRTWLVGEGLLLAFLIAYSVMAVRTNIEIHRQASDALDDKLTGRSQIAKKIASYMENTRLLEERFSTLKEIERTRGVVSRTLADVAQNLPLGQAWLTRIDMDTTSITMHARGQELRDIVPFKEQMEGVSRLLFPQVLSQTPLSDGIEFTVIAGVEKTPSAEITKLREKLRNREVDPFTLVFEDLSDPKGSHQRFVVSIQVLEPLNKEERTELVMDILNAAQDADLGYEQQNFIIIFQTPTRMTVGEYHIEHQEVQDILQGKIAVSDLTLVEPVDTTQAAAAAAAAPGGV